MLEHLIPFLGGAAVASLLWGIEHVLRSREHEMELASYEACMHVSQERRVEQALRNTVPRFEPGKWRCPHCRGLVGRTGEKLVPVLMLADKAS